MNVFTNTYPLSARKWVFVTFADFFSTHCTKFEERAEEKQFNVAHPLGSNSHEMSSVGHCQIK